MKFVVIGPTWPFRGGIAHYTTLLVQHLRERHQVRFLTYLSQYPKLLYPGNTAMDPSPDSSVLRLECDRLLTPWSVLSWWKAYRIVRDEQPDALVLQWWTPFWSPMLFFLTRLLHRRGAKTRVIFLCHHIIPPEGGYLDWFLARRILWRGHAFVVMSEEDFALLRRGLPWARIKSTFHPPYDVFNREPVSQADARAKLGLAAGAPTLLFFGFVRRHKGLRTLIEAMPAVRSRLPDAQLVIAGEFWEDEQQYRDLIAQLGLGDCVRTFSAYIPNDEIATYFSAADAVVMPYLEATQSGVAQIAISFEKPMIASNVGGMPDSVRDGVNGLLVPPANAAALADAIARLFEDGLIEPFTATIRATKEAASWAPLVKIIEELAVAPADPAERPAHGQASPRVL